MNIRLMIAALGVVISVPALAAVPPAKSCSSAPEAQWQPKSALESKLKAQGLEVTSIDVAKGCYTATATDQTGRKDTFTFNAETLDELIGTKGHGEEHEGREHGERHGHGHGHHMKGLELQQDD